MSGRTQVMLNFSVILAATHLHDAPAGFWRGFVWCWLAALFVAGLIYRLVTHRPIFRPRFPDAQLTLTWTSGRSLWNAYTKQCRATRCLWVVVTRDELNIGVHFPWNLFPPLVPVHLEHRIKGRDIISMERRQKFFLGEGIAVTFRRADGLSEVFMIESRQLTELQRAIESIRNHPASTTSSPPVC